MARADDIEQLRRRLNGKRWVWVERPTLLHARSDRAGQCPCGCESWSGEAEEERGARIVSTIPGPELILDRWTGERHLRSDQSELDGTLAAFDELKRDAANVAHVYMPRRCYAAQLLAITATPKVKGIFGGSRGGKTQALAEEAVDVWMALGGPGVHLWWVAPQLSETMRAVRKLVTGEAIKGGKHGETRPALFPMVLVADWPKTLEQIKRGTAITLADGTVFELRYAGRGEGKDGGHFKGDPVAWIGVDEGAEIMAPEAWHELIGRTTDSGGRITTATTPKVGSPLKHLVYDEGEDLAANDGAYLTGWVRLTMRDNPWIVPVERERTIATLLKAPNGKDLVRQNVDGEWVVPGERLWEHFDEKVHVIEWHRRDLDGYKLDGRALVNVTEILVGSFFRDTTAPSLYRVGGQDFNGRGNVTIVWQAWCPVGLDPGDPGNLVIYVEDVVVKAGEPREAARFLRNQAGAKRGIRHDYFAGLAISCDSSGAQDRPQESATGNVHAMFTLCDEYVKAGFDMRPCHRSENGKPVNPEKLAQESVLHGLMERKDLGQLAPRYAAGDTSLPPSVRFLVNKARCPELIKSLQEQARNERGFRRKRSDTRDDRLSDPIDALLYGLWPHLADPDIYPRVQIGFE
jgi:hypothetical protein